MRNPLLPITASLAAGIWAAPYFYLSAPEQLFFIGLVLLSAALLLRFGYNTHGLVMSWVGFFLCGTFLAAAEHSFLPPQHIESLARRGLFRPEQPSEILGWARTASVPRPGGEYFDLELTEVRQGDRIFPAEGRVRLYHFASSNRTPPPDIAYGTRLSLSLRDLRRPRNFLTPGSFDWESYIRRRGIYFTGLVRDAAEVEVLTGRGGTRWRAGLAGLRKQFLAHIDRLFPSREDPFSRGPILKAMLLGDDNWLSPATESLFQESGTYHVLVISGLHVGALALGLFWIFSLLRLSPWLTTLLVVLSVVAFAVLAGAGIPVLRATLMILIYLAARLLYRERALLNSLAAAALFLLVLHPSDLRDSSFQLSFLAVLVLATIALPVVQGALTPFRLALRDLEDKELDKRLEPRQAQFRQDMRILLDRFCNPVRRKRRPSRFLRPALATAASGLIALGEALLFTLFMQAGFVLVMVVYFHRVAWSGIMANLVVLLLTTVLIPLGFVVLLASLVWWPVAEAGAWALGILVSWLHRIAAWAAQFDGLNSRVPTPPLWLSFCFLATLFFLAIVIARRSRWTWLGTAALFCLGAALTLAPYPAQLPQERLEITTLDVGQGDSLFVAFPEGTTMLIDGGGAIPVSGVPSRLDIGESVVSAFLWSRRLQALDFMVLTHAHWDHLAGLLTVLKNFRVRELWVGPGPQTENLVRLLELAASRGVRVVKQHSGDRRKIDGVEVAILSPPADWNPRRVSNNDSLVLRLQYGQRTVLLPGDVESRMERRLVENGSPLVSDILKVPHHGSKTSSTLAFLSRVTPSFGVISVGAYSRFGHPHAEVLESLRRAGIRSYRTDKDGSVVFLTDGNRIELSTFRDHLRPWPRFSLF